MLLKYLFCCLFSTTSIGALDKLTSCGTYDSPSLEAYFNVDLMPILKIAKHVFLK